MDARGGDGVLVLEWITRYPGGTSRGDIGFFKFRLDSKPSRRCSKGEFSLRRFDCINYTYFHNLLNLPVFVRA